MRSRSAPLGCVLAIASVVAGGCSIILDPELSVQGTTAFGGSCGNDDECETGTCRASRCTRMCASSTECGDSADCTGGICTFVGPPPISGTLKVGYLYVGPVTDHGWTKAHDVGREYLVSHLPDVEAHFSPSIATPDAAAEIDAFVARGDNVIIGTSYDFLVPIQSAALRYPHVNFLICAGFQTGPNLGSYFGHMEQVLYMAGRLAGNVTRTNIIGVPGPIVIPETVRHINAFAQGVRSVNPEARVLVKWVLAWFDPPGETSATQELAAAGADIILTQTDTSIPIEVSRDLTTTDPESSCTTSSQCPGGSCVASRCNYPVYSIGYDNPDSCSRFAPDRCLASAYWNWGPMVTRILTQMREGTWRPQTAIWEQMKSDPDESVAYLSEINADVVPGDTRVDVETLIPALATGEEGLRLPFAGPVRDSAGMQRIAAGGSMSDTDMLRMCWFVEGVYEVDGSPGMVPRECVGDR